MTFKVWGVNFEISYLFACSVLLCIACDKTNSFIPMLLSITCHEAAHVIVLNIFSCEIKKVKLAAGTIGIEFNKQVDGLKHMIALLAGPAANILLALIGCIINNDIWFMINLVLAIYNLLPIRGLDGCDILELIMILEHRLLILNKCEKCTVLKYETRA